MQIGSQRYHTYHSYSFLLKLQEFYIYTDSFKPIIGKDVDYFIFMYNHRKRYAKRNEITILMLEFLGQTSMFYGHWNQANPCVQPFNINTWCYSYDCQLNTHLVKRLYKHCCSIICWVWECVEVSRLCSIRLKLLIVFFF